MYRSLHISLKRGSTVYEPGSDSELSDLFDSDDLWSKLDLEIDQIDPDTEADNVLSISNEHGD